MSLHINIHSDLFFFFNLAAYILKGYCVQSTILSGEGKFIGGLCLQKNLPSHRCGKWAHMTISGSCGRLCWSEGGCGF